MDKDATFTQVPNRILEAMYATENKITGMQFRVLIYVIREMYGFHEFNKLISVNRMAEKLGKDRRMVYRAIKDLEAMGIIKVSHSTGTKPSLFAICDPSEWSC